MQSKMHIIQIQVNTCDLKLVIETCKVNVFEVVREGCIPAASYKAGTRMGPYGWSTSWLSSWQCKLKLFCILIAICTYFQIGIKELGNMCYPHGVSSKAVNLAGITVFCRKECYDPSGAFVNSAFLSLSFPICLSLYLSFGITQFCWKDCYDPCGAFVNSAS